MIIEIIYLPPITKKNSQQILINKATGRPFIMASKKYKEYEQEAGLFLKHKNKNISTRVNVQCLFYMQTHRKVDLNNLLEAATDTLVKYNVLSDDNSDIVAGHDGSRVLYDKNSPRTVIKIETLNEV